MGRKEEPKLLEADYTTLLGIARRADSTVRLPGEYSTSKSLHVHIHVFFMYVQRYSV